MNNNAFWPTKSCACQKVDWKKKPECSSPIRVYKLMMLLPNLPFLSILPLKAHIWLDDLLTPSCTTRTSFMSSTWYDVAIATSVVISWVLSTNQRQSRLFGYGLGKLGLCICNEEFVTGRSIWPLHSEMEEPNSIKCIVIKIVYLQEF